MAITHERFLENKGLGTPMFIYGTGAPVAEIRPAGTEYINEATGIHYLTDGAGVWTQVLDSLSSIAQHGATACTGAAVAQHDATACTGAAVAQHDATACTGAAVAQHDATACTGAAVSNHVMTNVHTSCAPIAAELISISADALAADGARVLTAAAIAETAPDVPRGLAVRITIAVNAITAGTLDLVGVGWAGQPVTESISLVTGASVTRNSTKGYVTVTSATIVGLVGGGGAGDNVSIGVSETILLPAIGGATNFVGRFTAVADTVDAVPAREAVAGYAAGSGLVTPTTAPNGARVYWFGYSYEAGHIVTQPNTPVLAHTVTQPNTPILAHTVTQPNTPILAHTVTQPSTPILTHTVTP